MKALHVLGICLLIAACSSTETEYSETLHEKGKVTDLIFVPSGHGRDVAVGFDMSGKGGVSVTPINVRIPARYGIVFECEHGSFAVEGKRELWMKLKEGMPVDIQYKEVYLIDPEGQRTLADLDFITATPQL